MKYKRKSEADTIWITLVEEYTLFQKIRSPGKKFGKEFVLSNKSRSCHSLLAAKKKNDHLQYIREEYILDKS